MRPPPGRQQLSREFIARHQRARIIAALAEETVAKGYRAVTVADIVRRAGIARNTFYENFPSKEDCFLAAQDYAVEEALRRVVEAADRGRELAGPGRRRARRLPRLRRRRAGAGPDLHRRGALGRPRRAGALRGVPAGLLPAVPDRPQGLSARRGAAGDARGDDHRRHLLDHLPADHPRRDGADRAAPARSWSSSP